MSSENKSLSDEARSCIRQYLSAIERALAEAGASLDERRAVTADVESQILEMLGVPAGAEPTLRDVEHVIARLDKPADYAAAVALPQEALAAARRETDSLKQRRASRRTILVAAVSSFCSSLVIAVGRRASRRTILVAAVAGACAGGLLLYSTAAALLGIASRRADEAKRQAMRAQLEALEAARRRRRASPSEHQPNENRP